MRQCRAEATPLVRGHLAPLQWEGPGRRRGRPRRRGGPRTRASTARPSPHATMASTRRSLPPSARSSSLEADPAQVVGVVGLAPGTSPACARATSRARRGVGLEEHRLLGAQQRPRPGPHGPARCARAARGRDGRRRPASAASASIFGPSAAEHPTDGGAGRGSRCTARCPSAARYAAMADSGLAYTCPRRPSTRFWWLTPRPSRNRSGKASVRALARRPWSRRRGPRCWRCRSRRRAARSPTAGSARCTNGSRPATSGSHTAAVPQLLELGGQLLGPGRGDRVEGHGPQSDRWKAQRGVGGHDASSPRRGWRRPHRCEPSHRQRRSEPSQLAAHSGWIRPDSATSSPRGARLPDLRASRRALANQRSNLRSTPRLRPPIRRGSPRAVRSDSTRVRCLGEGRTVAAQGAGGVVPGCRYSGDHSGRRHAPERSPTLCRWRWCRCHPTAVGGAPGRRGRGGRTAARPRPPATSAPRWSDPW